MAFSGLRRVVGQALDMVAALHPHPVAPSLGQAVDAIQHNLL